MHQLVDYICDYYENIDSWPAKASTEPGEYRAAFGEKAPEEPVSWEDTMDQVNELIFKGSHHWQHPRNHGYVAVLTSFPAIMGEMISKTINSLGFAWHSSPIVTELEVTVTDWMATAMGLPDFYKFGSGLGGGGVIHNSSSEAVVIALIGAKNYCPGPNPVQYASEMAHFSVAKAARILGVEHRTVHTVADPKTGHYLMDIDELISMIAADKAAGKTPVMITAAFGATATFGLDPIEPIGRVAKQERIWFHVDAAYAGVALICPEYREVATGLELSDSFNTNGHKLLLTGFNSATLYVKNLKYLAQTLKATGSYIVPSKPNEIDLIDYMIPQGTDFPALRYWMVIQHYGLEGLRAHLRRFVQLAQTFERKIKEIEDFEVLFPSELGIVCFVVKGDDAMTRKVGDLLQERTDSIFTAAEAKHKKFLRFCICSEYTEERHIDLAIAVIQEELAAAKASA